MSHRLLAVAAALALLVASVTTASAAPPSNDGWSTPAVIDALPASISVELTEATLTDDPQFCGSGTSSVWYTLTPASDTILTIGLAADPWMGAVHVGLDGPFDFRSCVFAGGSSSIPVEGGHTVFLQVSTDGSATTLEVSAVDLLANDRFDDAEVIDTLPATVSADVTRTTGFGDGGTCVSRDHGAWYRYTPSADERLDVTAGDFDHVAITRASSTDVLTCVSYWEGTRRVDLQAGTAYHFLLVTDQPSQLATLSLRAVPPAPPNDRPEDAIAIGSLPFQAEVAMDSATPDDEPFFCFESGAHSVWYEYTPSADEIVHLAVTGPSARAAVLSNDEDASACTADPDRDRFLARAGETYRIALGTSQPSATIGLSVTSSPPPSLDIQVDASGTIKKVAGTAVITGTATCSASDEAFLVLELRQRIGRQGLATGEMDGSIPCGPTPTRWSMGVPGQNMPFGTGSVSVSWRAFAGDWPIEVSDAGETVVKLKGN